MALHEQQVILVADGFGIMIAEQQQASGAKHGVHLDKKCRQMTAVPHLMRGLQSDQCVHAGGMLDPARVAKVGEHERYVLGKLTEMDLGQGMHGS